MAMVWSSDRSEISHSKMERRCALRQRLRSSLERVHGGEAPPRLQVIGFTVCAPPPTAAEAEGKSQELASGAPRSEASRLFFSDPPAAAPPASSPRSALQQLLLKPSLPCCTSPPSPLRSLPPAASPLFRPPCSGNGAPATSISSLSKDQILPPISSVPTSAQQSNSSFGILESMAAQSGKAMASAEYDPANDQSLITTDCCKSVDQSQIVLISPPSPRNRSASVDECSTQKPSSRASIKQNYAAFHDDTGYTDMKICVERPDPKVAEIESSSLHLDGEEAPTDSSQIGVLQVSPSSLRNEKSRKSSWTDQEGTGKKNSLFMFVVSSPVPEGHRLHHRGEYDLCRDAYFLSSCHLCRRHLSHGKDVFMYSGDKAFCSMECRYQQIAIDERKERRLPPIIRSGAPQVYQHTCITTSAPPTATLHHPVVSISRPNFINTAAAA